MPSNASLPVPLSSSSSSPKERVDHVIGSKPAPLPPGRACPRPLHLAPTPYLSVRCQAVFPFLLPSTTVLVACQMPLLMNLHYATPPHVRVHFPHWTHIQSPIGRFSSKSVRSPLSEYLTMRIMDKSSLFMKSRIREYIPR